MKGVYFRKEFQLLPGIRLNISKKGFSFSIGPSNAHITTGTSGTHLYLDLPGSGMYYRKKLNTKTSNGNGGNGNSNGNQSAEQPKPDMGFLERLTAPMEEIALVGTVRALYDGDEVTAYQRSQDAAHLADGAFMAGFLALKNQHCPEAIAYFSRALQNKDTLGKTFEKYEIQMGVALPITEDIYTHIEPSENGVLLALAEAYQYDGQPKEAIKTLLTYRQKDPEDLMMRLSLAEMLNQLYRDDAQVQQKIVELAEGIHNESPVHAALMFYRAQALRKLGLLEGARDTLTRAMRRKKGYPDHLLLALRYERGLIYEAMGQDKQAREEFQKVYAQSPSYEDVAAKLGL